MTAQGTATEIRAADQVVFGVTLIFNLALAGIFVARLLGWEILESVLGIFVLLLIIPLTWVIWQNYWEGREWWTYGLPGLLVAFLLVELLLDYVFALDFRSSAVLLWPYLVLYYSSSMVMVGYNFMIRMRWGWITLATYFLNLAAALFSYAVVGHG